MPLGITQREMDGIYLLGLKGRLVLRDESSGFRATVDKLLPIFETSSTEGAAAARF